MNNNYFSGRSIFRFFAAILFFSAVFFMPQRLDAQVSLEAERAFLEARIRILRDRRDPLGFNLPLLSGGITSLASHRGKVVILNFWATWCPPCREEMPSMEVLYNLLKSQGLEILAVNIREDRTMVQQFIRANGYTFPVPLDTNGGVGSQYGISAIPTSYILDREGKIIARIVGSIDWSTPGIIAAFEALLRSR